MRRNPFMPKTEEERAKDNKTLLAIANKVKMITKLGAKCLANPDFIKYRNEVESQRAWLIKAAEGYKNSDPIEYAFVVSNILTQTAVLGVMIESISRDAKKKKGKPDG